MEYYHEVTNSFGKNNGGNMALFGHNYVAVYFNRKKKNPCDEKNTIKALIIKALIASVIMTLLFNGGLIAVYFREITGG